MASTVYETEISAGAASLVEAIKANTTLTKLGLLSNKIGDAGAAAIKVKTTLTVLDLSQNNIGDAGAFSRAEAIKVNTTRAWLNLLGNNIGDAGAAFIFVAGQMSTQL